MVNAPLKNPSGTPAKGVGGRALTTGADCCGCGGDGDDTFPGGMVPPWPTHGYLVAAPCPGTQNRCAERVVALAQDFGKTVMCAVGSAQCPSGGYRTKCYYVTRSSPVTSLLDTDLVAPFSPGSCCACRSGETTPDGERECDTNRCGEWNPYCSELNETCNKVTLTGCASGAVHGSTGCACCCSPKNMTATYRDVQRVDYGNGAFDEWEVLFGSLLYRTSGGWPVYERFDIHRTADGEVRGTSEQQIGGCVPTGSCVYRESFGMNQEEACEALVSASVRMTCDMFTLDATAVLPPNNYLFTHTTRSFVNRAAGPCEGGCRKDLCGVAPGDGGLRGTNAIIRRMTGV